jgi:hypothetical protein
MAARNLTIERAPTRPKDKASEDLTIEITSIVVIDRKMRFLENDFRFERACPNFSYNSESKKAKNVAKIKLMANEKREISGL